jgi:tetratricopeptide (TPR) repeat protein
VILYSRREFIPFSQFRKLQNGMNPVLRASSAMARSGWLRFLLLALILGLLLGVPAAVIGYRSYRYRSDVLLEKGKQSLAGGDLGEAERIARALANGRHDSAAHLLRGRILLKQGKLAMDNAEPPFPYEGIQQAGQLVLGGCGFSGYSPALRGVACVSAALVQQPFPWSIPGGDDFQATLHEFVQILDDDPLAAEATILASECLVRLEERRPAAMALHQLVDRQPDNVDAHRWLAAIYIDLKSPKPAVEHLRQWVRLDPGNARPNRWLGFFSREESEDSSESIAAYRRALELGLEPLDRAAVLRELAETLLTFGVDYQAVLDTLAMGSNAFQSEPLILLLRAECLVGLGKRDEAVRLLDELLKEHSALPTAILLRAKIYLQEDQPQAAIQLLEKLVSLHPNNYAGRHNLMLAYQLNKDERKAAEQKRQLDRLLATRERIAELQKQAAKNPWNARARHELALIYSSISRPEALAWIQAAFACSPGDPRIRATWTQLNGHQPPPSLLTGRERLAQK